MKMFGLSQGLIVIGCGAINWLKCKGVMALIGCVLLFMNCMCNCGWGLPHFYIYSEFFCFIWYNIVGLGVMVSY